jgi:GNAT superfamily N-acetyltransferase
MDGVRLRRAGPADDAGIRGLLAAVFPANAKADGAVLRWQYWDNPFGEVVSWVWDDRGQIVCHWACVPIPMVLGGRRVVGCKTADAATLPAYRGRGLFAALGRQLFADAAARGFPVAITHPNPNAARGVEQAGAQLVARVPAFVRAPLLVRRPRAQRVATPPDGLDELWGRAGAQVRNGVARDAAWWGWRYGQRPGGGYRIAAFREGTRLRGAAVGVERRVRGVPVLFVLELLVDADEVAADVVAALLRGERLAGAVTVALPGSPVAGAVRAAGFRRLPQRLEPRLLRFGVADLTRTAPDLARRPWSIAWGDLDHL